MGATKSHRLEGFLEEARGQRPAGCTKASCVSGGAFSRGRGISCSSPAALGVTGPGVPGSPPTCPCRDPRRTLARPPACEQLRGPGGQLHCRPPSPPVCPVSGVFVLAALRAVYELCLNSPCQCPVSGSGPFCPWKCHAPLDFRVRAPWGLRCLMGPEDLLICRGSALCCVVG